MKRREVLKRAIAWLSVFLSVSACCVWDYRRVQDLKRVVYDYQDLIEGVGNRDSLWRDIESLVGDPHEDYYYDIPRYSLFWEDRKKR